MTKSASPSKRAATSLISSLEKMTTIVADTGDMALIKKYTPTDATTNPSLIYKAALLPEYAPFIDEAIAYARGKETGDEAVLGATLDYLSCKIGSEIAKIVPGYVSTEVDARLSFDTEGTIAKANSLISIYESLGVDRSRILIKIASTWEGIQAAKVLQAAGITCNLTLLFSIAQAVACADAKCTLISPFVGRIMDWFKKAQGVSGFAPAEDPGVMSVTTIYNYYKKFGHSTIVMGASFRNIDEIKELAGCDRLTISPALLQELSDGVGTLPQKLDASKAAAAYPGPEMVVDEKAFRWMMNEDAMATEKLAEGIRGFTADILKLEDVIKAKL